ncbi:MAG: M3 family peptidase, partial [Rhodoglobus sp.]|nr:M3 family peptidase [Rhodoglobus sp.]
MSNPFFEPSTLPYGMPPFADITDEHYRPAFEKGMADQLAEISAITRRRDMPTFENTMIPLERSGQLLERVPTVFFNKSSADSNDFTNELEEEIAPLLAAHSDAIKLDSQLYWRIKTIHEQLDSLDLDAESRYLVERYFIEFTVAGAGLTDEEK